MPKGPTSHRLKPGCPSNSAKQDVCPGFMSNPRRRGVDSRVLPAREWGHSPAVSAGWLPGAPGAQSPQTCAARHVNRLPPHATPAVPPSRAVSPAAGHTPDPTQKQCPCPSHPLSECAIPLQCKDQRDGWPSTEGTQKTSPFLLATANGMIRYPRRGKDGKNPGSERRTVYRRLHTNHLKRRRHNLSFESAQFLPWHSLLPGG